MRRLARSCSGWCQLGSRAITHQNLIDLQPVSQPIAFGKGSVEPCFGITRIETDQQLPLFDGFTLVHQTWFTTPS